MTKAEHELLVRAMSDLKFDTGAGARVGMRVRSCVLACACGCACARACMRAHVCARVRACACVGVHGVTIIPLTTKRASEGIRPGTRSYQD